MAAPSAPPPVADPSADLRQLLLTLPAAPDPVAATQKELDDYALAIRAFATGAIPVIQNVGQYLVQEETKITDSHRRAGAIARTVLTHQRQERTAQAQARAARDTLTRLNQEIQAQQAELARSAQLRNDEPSLVNRVRALRTELAVQQAAVEASRTQLITGTAQLRREQADLQARIDRDRALYGTVQDVGQLTARLEEERRARAAAEVLVNQINTEAHARIEAAEATLSQERAAGDATRSEGYVTLLRQRVLDGGSIDSPRHAQIVSELAAGRQRDILRRFEAMGTALAAETRQAVRNNNQVSAICNSLAATLGGARLPSAPTVLLYRFETVEDATLFRDKARITGARLDIQRAPQGASPGVNPAIVIMQEWQK